MGDKYLYYTNKNTTGKIVIDLRAGDFGLNLEQSNGICESEHTFFKNEECKKYSTFGTEPFYDKIDNWETISFLSISNSTPIDDQIDLNKIYYKGICSENVSNREIIKNFEKNIEIYKILYIFKVIIVCIFIIFFIPFLCIVLNSCCKEHFITITIVFLSLTLINFIFSTINLSIYVKYLYNFMNMIDKHSKKDVYILYIIIASFAFLLYFVFILSFISIFRWYFSEERLYDCLKELYEKGIIIYVSFNCYNLCDNEKYNNHKRLENNNAFSSNRRNEINQRDINGNNQITINNNIIPFRQNKEEESKTNTDNVAIEINNNEINNNNIIINNIDNPGSNRNNRQPQENQTDRLNSEMLRLDHKSLCSICDVNSIEVTIIPCGHRCLCHGCYEKAKNKIKTCPKCREKIEFFSEDNV